MGFGLFWRFALQRAQPVAPPLRVEAHPKPVEPDRSEAFETVTDRTPMSLRDSAAYAHVLERARARTPAEMAEESRRDVLMTHLWERPERYRGVPIHIDGTALRVLRYESKLSKTGWLYEAWIDTPESGKYPYVCVFESSPKGFPLGPNLSERVVFNGYFLKIMKYEAADVARGAPLLVGWIGWDPSQSPDAAQPGSGSLLQWTLILLPLMFIVTLARWLGMLGGSLRRQPHRTVPVATRTDEIDAATLEQWVQNAGEEDVEPAKAISPPEESRALASGPADPSREDEPGECGSAGGGAQATVEAQSIPSPESGGRADGSQDPTSDPRQPASAPAACHQPSASSDAS
jgi:hypothetical protein